MDRTLKLKKAKSIEICTPRPNLPVNSSYLLTSYFCIPVPYDEEDILFWVLVLQGLVGLHRTIQFQLLWHLWLGHRLGLLWNWMVCLVKEPRSFCCFWDCTQVLHFGLFCWLWDYSISSKGFLPTVKILWSSELNSPIPVHFSSLIPKMLMFTLAISCLTTSSLPWFMDLTLQISMQYCSLQHWTLLSPPDTSTTGHCFHFGSASSFLLELFFPCFSSSILNTNQSGGLIFQCHIFLPFHTVHGVLKARMLKWFSIPFSSGPHFVRTLHHDLPVHQQMNG